MRKEVGNEKFIKKVRNELLYVTITPEIVFRAVILQQMDDEHLSGYAKWVASKLDEDI